MIFKTDRKSKFDQRKEKMMNLLRNSKAERQTGKKVVKVDAEYYSDLQCKEYLLEAVAKVVVDIGDEKSKLEKIAAILQIQLLPELEGYIGGF